MSGRATIRLGIGPHSSSFSFFFASLRCFALYCTAQVANKLPHHYPYLVHPNGHLIYNGSAPC